MARVRLYFSNQERTPRFINRWDILLLLLLFSLLFFLGWAGKQMATPYQLGEQIPISLDPKVLPAYAIRTVLRMFIALLFSLIFTFIFGAWAAKNKRAEQIIIPAIDILQSVPVLSFLSITIVGFIRLFPGSMLGPECASIFAIFTAQVWNMMLGFYQSLKTLPHDLKEAADMFQLSSWQRFWKVEVPFSMSSLLWNMMMSMSASWFFVVLSEAISVSNQDIRLPGIGSYIALAITEHSMHAVGYAILSMVIVIFLYDQILFRPLVTWSEKFKIEQTPNEHEYHSWLVSLIRRSRLLSKLSGGITIITNQFVNARIFNFSKPKVRKEPNFEQQRRSDRWWNTLLITGLIGASILLLDFILTYVDIQEIFHVFILGAYTGSRVIVLIILSSLIWVPVGVWIGRHPRLTQLAQPIIQFLAAFPANLFYPLFVVAIVTFKLNVEIWVTPLMILGTQWYILFNVIAGASSIPRELYLAANNFEVKGWLWWKRLALPGIFPYYITGAITAAGGAWNASIVAEWVSWGNTTLRATGLGEYIHAWTNAGDFPKIALGTAMMCLYVLAFNHIIWRPLYRMAETRYNIN
jgi:NitT/TauT family transport system permease protein